MSASSPGTPHTPHHVAALARSNGWQSCVVFGPGFPRARELNHWRNVTRWPARPTEALVGMRAATGVTPNRQPFDLTFQGKPIELAPAGLLQTGAAEDSRIYLDQSEFQAWTGVVPTTIEIAINGPPDEIERGMNQLSAALPTAAIRPVRQ